MTKYFCDKCKEEITTSDFNIIKQEETSYEVGIRHIGKAVQPLTTPILDFGTIVLCSACAKEANTILKNFIKNKL